MYSQIAMSSSTPFILDDFLLGNKQARRLYHKYAAKEPIFDYHCHIPPAEIASNRAFRNLFEIWLEGDHYKWRAMRTNGVAEKYVTGRPRRRRSSSPGLRPSPTCCAIHSITGRIWS